MDESDEPCEKRKDKEKRVESLDDDGMDPGSTDRNSDFRVQYRTMNKRSTLLHVDGAYQL